MFTYKYIPAFCLLALLATPAAAVDAEFSETTVQTTISQVNSCTSLNCIEKSVDSARKKMRGKPDYQVVAVHFAALRELMRECIRGCGPERVKEIKARALAAQADVSAHRLVEIRVFGGVFQGIAARMP